MITSLLYHDVVEPGNFASSGFQGSDADVYKLTRPQFEAHLNLLKHAVGKDEVRVFDSAARIRDAKTLLLTFDDGGASALVIGSMLEGCGWRGHFLVTTDYIGQPGFLTSEQIRELHRRGHVIGSHSCSHPTRMSYCSQAQIQREWTLSIEVLSAIVGERTRVASVPGGYYSRQVAECAATEGIELLFNSEPTDRYSRIGNCFVLGRYSIRAGTSPGMAASLAQGAYWPRLRQQLYWNAKGVAKRLGGSAYVAIRKSLLRKRA